MASLIFFGSIVDMPITADTDERFSMMAMGIRLRLMPFADGAIDSAGDRQQFLMLYRGITAEPPPPSGAPGGLGGKGGALGFSLNSHALRMT